jgi:hypothetical protein
LHPVPWTHRNVRDTRTLYWRAVIATAVAERPRTGNTAPGRKHPGKFPERGKKGAALDKIAKVIGKERKTITKLCGFGFLEPKPQTRNAKGPAKPPGLVSYINAPTKTITANPIITT